MCIGLVCTPEGLPLNYEVFAGNRADVTTVEEIVTKMEDRFGHAERIWVMDRGMVSEQNIAFLRRRKAHYIVGTPKEKAMLEAQMERLSRELLKVDRSLRLRPRTDTGASERRIGRWQDRYPAAAKWIDAKLLYDDQNRACGLRLSCPLPGQLGHPMLAKGAYLLRTNCTEDDPAKLWRWYIQLTQAEAAFRTAKSDIGLRPIYHQKTERVEAHLLVCFLSLASWRSLESWMNAKGLGSRAAKLLEAVSTIRSMDVVVPVKRDQSTLELRLRTVAKPDQDVAVLLTHLGLNLPKGSKVVQNVVEKND